MWRAVVHEIVVVLIRVVTEVVLVLGRHLTWHCLVYVLIIMIELVVLLVMVGMQVILVVGYVHVVVVVCVLESLKFLLDLMVGKSWRCVLENWRLSWSDNRSSAGRWSCFRRCPHSASLNLIQQQVFCFLLTQHIVHADDAMRS